MAAHRPTANRRVQYICKITVTCQTPQSIQTRGTVKPFQGSGCSKRSWVETEEVKLWGAG